MTMVCNNHIQYKVHKPMKSDPYMFVRKNKRNRPNEKTRRPENSNVIAVFFLITKLGLTFYQ